MVFLLLNWQRAFYLPNKEIGMAELESFTARERDLGGFSVRRILPYATHRMIGPFIFFDHIGPAHFPPEQGIDVRPHPHINLATVTYLFEGKIHHRDSLGSDQLIEPGAINWMTAGHGIVHSERSPDDLRKTGSSLHGVQCWVALPVSHEEMAPNFTHYPALSLPVFQLEQASIRLLIGSLFGHTSPVQTYSDMFYASAHLPAGSRLTLPASTRETALYVISGNIKISQQHIEPYSMVVSKKLEPVTIAAKTDTHLMLLGGEPIGERHIYWNFVSSSVEKIALAKQEWAQGPGTKRFPIIPSDDKDFIPLPEDKNPKGTIM